MVKKKTDLLPQIENLSSFDLFEEIYQLVPSRRMALKNFAMLSSSYFKGNHLFEENQITDKSEQFIAGELIREKVMRQLGDELPHSAAVSIESFVSLSASLKYERAYMLSESQKKIVIGSKGLRLKRIGSDARRYRNFAG